MKWVVGIVAIFLLVGFGLSVRQEVWLLKTLSYENNTDIRNDLASLVGNYPQLKGSTIYIENSRNEYQPQNIWEQNNIADAYIQGDFEPADGGVPFFTEDEDALLIISKDLFEQYSNILSGRIILVDGNDYLIFCNEFYG